MLRQLLAIAKNTFLESVRQPIFFILIVLCGLAMLFTTWGTGFSMGYTDSSEVSGDNKLLLDIGLATVFATSVLLAAFIATAVVSREIDNKTILTVISKPVGRPLVILGKYLGVCAAELIAVLTMLLFLQMAIRHQVMSTAADTLDMPVITFTVLAVAISLGVGIWGNFFYGWGFTQTTALLLFPLMIGAFFLVLAVSKNWTFQPLSRDFKPQIALASLCVVFAVLVLTAVATVASTRLGQVMTIVVCAGVFVFGLLSNYFLGSRAVSNSYLTQIAAAAPELEGQRQFRDAGDTYVLKLKPTQRGFVLPGAPIYYSSSPNGYPMSTPNYTPYKGDLNDRSTLYSSQTPPAVVITAVKDREITIRNVGSGLKVSAPPLAGDYIFTQPTRTNPIALTAWGIVPNVQFFWLSDAVTQNQPIPLSHVGSIALYSALQIGALLSLGVILFQRREVG